MIRRSPLARSQKPIARSPIARSAKRIRPRNPERQAKRDQRYRKMLRSPQYLAAKAEAMKRAGDRCEWNDSDGVFDTIGTWFGVGNKTERDPFRNDPSRCEMTENLEAHHLRYPKSRPLAVTDLVILCNWHHRLAESLKPHKQGRRAFA